MIDKGFDRWWNADELTQTNPYTEETPAWWAWEGWRAAKREWVGLTDEEIQSTVNEVATGVYQTSDTFARALEAKLKEKNT